MPELHEKNYHLALRLTQKWKSHDNHMIPPSASNGKVNIVKAKVG